MTETNDYDDEDREDQGVDEDEAKAAQKGGEDVSDSASDLELAEAETLSVTARQKARDQLEDELARFLAQGGRITQVPPDESAND